MGHNTPSTTPLVPNIKEFKITRSHYNTIEIKLRYAPKEENNGEKFYNDEVGAWYYEILFEQKGQQAKVLTATPSWAAYVVDAPLVDEKKQQGGSFWCKNCCPRW